MKGNSEKFTQYEFVMNVRINKTFLPHGAQLNSPSFYSHFHYLSSRSSTCKTFSNEHCEGDGLTVGCRPHQELTHMITRLKSEVYRLKASADPNCTVCWSAPCLNGGTCIPLNVTEYRYF